MDAIQKLQIEDTVSRISDIYERLRNAEREPTSIETLLILAGSLLKRIIDETK